MASLTIEMIDGPRKGDSITLNNTWEYPETHLCPWKDEDGKIHILTYKAHRIPGNPLKKGAPKIVYRYAETT